MKIYVSGTFTAQARLRVMAEKLWEKGHEITSSWLQETTKPSHLSYDQWMVQLATKDVAEVIQADCIIMDVTGDSTSGGRYTEWGVAVHPISPMLRYLVGGKRAADSSYPYGCFTHLAHRYFENWDELLVYFQTNHAGK